MKQKETLKCYEQISFSTQCQKQQGGTNNQNKFKEQNSNQLQNSFIVDQSFIAVKQINELQKLLFIERQKNIQLEKRNQQLMDMLVSASQSNVKRNQQFILEVQRKIYNSRVVKDLNSSSFKSNQTKQSNFDGPKDKRVVTEESIINKHYSSQTKKIDAMTDMKSQKNKENYNTINEKTWKTSFEGNINRSSRQNLKSYSRQKLKTYNSQNVSGHNLNGGQISQNYFLLDPFQKKRQMNVFSKLQSKIGRF